MERVPRPTLQPWRSALTSVIQFEEECYLNIKDYLERINYRGPLAPTAETLRELQVAHLLAVPFENLSIHAGQPVVLDDDALFEKIVGRRRGGFCYEANGLFAALLRALGFNVTMLSAGVANAGGGFGPDFDHMTLMVTLDERWLVDVGFGDSFREPLLIDRRGEQRQGDRAYRIGSDSTHLILLQRDETDGDGGWKAQYRFTLQPHEYADYEEMCRYHQTSPQSHFTRARICSKATLDGRVTLSEMRLIKTKDDERQERVLTDEQEYALVLREQFGIVI
ncbi:MAG: arylamine N-acetyltransferase family protein [Pyrinomonadaceae bacterium]